MPRDDLPTGHRRRVGRDRSRTAVRAIASALRDPVAVILYLAGIFDWLSDNPVHSLVLFGAATALVWDSLRRRPRCSSQIGIPD